MGAIAVEHDHYTLINVFTVDPVDQDRMCQAIVEATDVIRGFPGFVSANLHKSHDGTKVVNYAQWRSKAEFDAMRAHPDAQAHFAECRAITDDIEPIFCRVEYVHEEPGR